MEAWPKHLRLREAVDRYPTADFVGPIADFDQMRLIPKHLWRPTSTPCFNNYDLVITIQKSVVWSAGERVCVLSLAFDTLVAVELSAGDRPGCRWSLNGVPSGSIPIEDGRYLLEGILHTRLMTFPGMYLEVDHPPTEDTEVLIFGLVFMTNRLGLHDSPFEYTESIFGDQTVSYHEGVAHVASPRPEPKIEADERTIEELLADPSEPFEVRQLEM